MASIKTYIKTTIDTKDTMYENMRENSAPLNERKNSLDELCNKLDDKPLNKPLNKPLDKLYDGLCDHHFHLHFLPEARRKQFCKETKISVWAVTVLPKQVDTKSKHSCVKEGLGFHPWELCKRLAASSADTKQELRHAYEDFEEAFSAKLNEDKFDKNIPSEDTANKTLTDGYADDSSADDKNLANEKRILIGEIGLDFTTSYQCFAQEQIKLLSFIFKTIKQSDKRFVLSLHARKSSGQVLELLAAQKLLIPRVPRNIGSLEQENQQVNYIFHWFSDSSQELYEVRKAGAYFSIGHRMLASKKGRSYAQSIESDSLLLETDDPASLEADNYSAKIHNERMLLTLEKISELRNNSPDLLKEHILSNQAKLMA